MAVGLVCTVVITVCRDDGKIWREDGRGDDWESVVLVAEGVMLRLEGVGSL